RDVGAGLVGPQQLRRQNVAENQRVVKVTVRTVETHLRQIQVELIAAVNGHEIFEEVAVGDDEAGGEHHHSHVLKVAHGDEVFQAIGLAQWNGDGQDHGKTGVNGAGDEVGWENRRVPARNDSGGKVEAHDRVHGENQGRREAGEKQIRGLVTVPVACGAAPAHGEHAVNDLLGLGERAVAECG